MSLTCPGEVVPKRVKRNGHHSVRGIKRLLHPVPVVDVDVDVKDALGKGGGDKGENLDIRGGGGWERGPETNVTRPMFIFMYNYPGGVRTPKKNHGMVA